jgi:hypothetical protein
MKKTALLLLLFLFWLPIYSQREKIIRASDLNMSHEQAIELLQKENAPFTEVLKKSLRSIEIAGKLRSANANKQKLDSVVISAKEKETYSYYSNGNLYTTLLQNWNDVTKKWDNKGKSEYSYNALGRITLEITYLWDANLSTWQGESKSEFTYENNNLTLYMEYTWSTTLNTWENASKVIYSYNAQNQLVVMEMYNWDKPNSKWIGQTKIENFYNGSLLDYSIVSSWNTTNGEWVYSNKSTFTYNDKSQVVLIVNSTWVVASSSWVNNLKTESSYDAQGHKLMAVSSTWNSVLNDWEYQIKSVSTYDELGNETTFSFYSWTDNAWQLIQETEYKFNSSGKLISETVGTSWVDVLGGFLTKNRTEYSYDGSGNAYFIVGSDSTMFQPFWQQKAKEERTYNNSFSYNDLVLPHTGIAFSPDFTLANDSDLFNHMLTRNILSNYTGAEWVVDSDAKLYYSVITITGSSTEKISGVSIYPNPATSYITINASPGYANLTLEIFNMTGKLLLSRAVTTNTQIPIEQLSTGIYLFRVKAGSNIIDEEKVIKQ